MQDAGSTYKPRQRSRPQTNPAQQTTTRPPPVNDLDDPTPADAPRPGPAASRHPQRGHISRTRTGLARPGSIRSVRTAPQTRSPPSPRAPEPNPVFGPSNLRKRPTTHRSDGSDGAALRRSEGSRLGDAAHRSLWVLSIAGTRPQDRCGLASHRIPLPHNGIDSDATGGRTFRGQPSGADYRSLRRTTLQASGAGGLR